MISITSAPALSFGISRQLLHVPECIPAEGKNRGLQRDDDTSVRNTQGSGEDSRLTELLVREGTLAGYVLSGDFPWNGEAILDLVPSSIREGLCRSNHPEVVS